MFSLLEYASIAINLHFFLRLDTRHPSDAFLHPVTQSQFRSRTRANTVRIGRGRGDRSSPDYSKRTQCQSTTSAVCSDRSGPCDELQQLALVRLSQIQ
jgi:hypothetical protein